MQIGQFKLKLDMVMGGAGDIARTARARTVGINGFVHGLQNHRILALAQIVVGTPDHDFALSLRRHPGRARKVTAMALQISKYPIAALGTDLTYRGLECGLVIHLHRP